MRFADEAAVMRHALVLASRGEGRVEPNPMVGAVVVDRELNLLGAGWHDRFGGPHAEVGALREAGERARGAPLVVTLEPCAHHGKTPPCVEAILAAGVRRVVVALGDPFPAVAGRGLQRLREAGLEVEVGLLAGDARALVAPFLSLVERGRPWVHAKWAMTLDGRIASRTGVSQWISNALSRGAVHALRGRMDAILVGMGTALADDPLLTARPAGLRIPVRVVVDSRARLPVTSRLVQSVGEAPLLVAAGEAAPGEAVERLRRAGAEVCICPRDSSAVDRSTTRVDLSWLLHELGRRQLTNVLVEGGGEVLGSLHDGGLLDELHVFVAPRLLGGVEAKSPVLGLGRLAPSESGWLQPWQVETLGGDLYLRTRVAGGGPGLNSGTGS